MPSSIPVAIRSRPRALYLSPRNDQANWTRTWEWRLVTLDKAAMVDLIVRVSLVADEDQEEAAGLAQRLRAELLDRKSVV